MEGSHKSNGLIGNQIRHLRLQANVLPQTTFTSPYYSITSLLFPRMFLLHFSEFRYMYNVSTKSTRGFEKLWHANKLR
jgi:hypothetical protein